MQGYHAFVFILPDTASQKKILEFLSVLFYFFFFPNIINVSYVQGIYLIFNICEHKNIHIRGQYITESKVEKRIKET